MTGGQTVFSSKGEEALVLVIVASEQDGQAMVDGLQSVDYRTHVVPSRTICDSIIDFRWHDVAAILLHPSLTQKARLEWLDFFANKMSASSDDFFAPVSVVVQEVLGSGVAELQAHGAARVLPGDLDYEALKHVLLASVDRFHEVRSLARDAADREQAVCGLMQARFEIRRRHEAASVSKLLSLVCDRSVEIQIGLSELFLNAIEHGVHRLGGDQKEDMLRGETFEGFISEREALDDRDLAPVIIDVSRADDVFCFDIKDPGDGFKHGEVLENAADLGRIYSGRGLLMARSCFQTIEYVGVGNHVRAFAKAR